MAADPRAAAAAAVAAVLGGRSLDRALPAATAGIAAEDRGLVAELAYGTLRLAPRLQAVLGALLDRPLRARDRDLQALLLVGLYQLAATRIPDHAAVAETVGAAASLGKGWARGLTNAVLRRYRRERETLEAGLPPAAAAAHPAWLYDAFGAQWPDALDAILAAGNSRPPMTLRVNGRRLSRGDYLARLAGAGIEARPGALGEQAVYLAAPAPVESLPGFADGDASVQDEAAQLAAAVLSPASGARVLDACAAPGGKACHLLETADCTLTAMDVDPARLQRVTDNLARLALDGHCVAADAADPAALAVHGPWDCILVDAPCSGSGVIRRHPDIKVLRQGNDPAQLARRQRAILEACWTQLVPGGRLLYVTCSLLAAENEDVVDAFLASTADARETSLTLPGGVGRERGVQLLPAVDGPDGLYFALLEKTP